MPGVLRTQASDRSGRAFRTGTVFAALVLVLNVASGRGDDALPDRALVRIGPTTPDGAELERVRLLALSPDGTRVATTGEPSNPKEDRRVRIWDARTGELLRTLVARDDLVTSMDFSPDGGLLATVCGDHPAGTQIWEVATGKLLATATGGTGQGQFRDDGRLLVVERFGTRDALLVLDPKTGAEVRRFPIRTHVRAAFTPDGRRTLLVERPRTPTIYAEDVEADLRLAKLEEGEKEPRAVAISPDGRTAAAIDGNDVLLWELATSTLHWGVGPVGDRPGVVHELKGHEGAVFRLAFSGDGRRLVTSSADKTVRLWDVATGEQLAELAGHDSLVTSLGLSADGTRIASGSFDRTVLVWNVAGIPLPAEAEAPPATPEAIDQLWSDLGSTNPGKAYTAIGRLEAHPGAVTTLAGRVHGTLVPAENERIRELIVDLDDDDYRVRHRATVALQKLRGIARPILLKSYETSLSEEVRNRIRRILRGDENTPRFDETDRRRMFRIVHAAEAVARTHTGQTRTDAIVVLKEIASEFPDAKVTAEAKAAAERVAR